MRALSLSAIHPASLAVDGQPVKGYNPRVELYCPVCGEATAATHREDGQPVFSCFTCGYQVRVNLEARMGICAECDGNIIPGITDYLCGQCRPTNPVDQRTTESRSRGTLKPAYRTRKGPNG